MTTKETRLAEIFAPLSSTLPSFLGARESLIEHIPYPRQEKKLPVVLSRDELARSSRFAS